jgi:hypothetical protein
MLVGLQGAGKTRTAAKIAKRLTERDKIVREFKQALNDSGLRVPMATTLPWRTKPPERIPIPGIETKSPVERPGFLFGLRQFPVLAPLPVSLHQTTRSNSLRRQERPRLTAC